MTGKTNVGGSALNAIISVNYPAGNICLCSNGYKTYKAKDSTGRAIFNVPLGTWTVSCTGADGTSSKEAIITEKGQTVILDFVKTMLMSGREQYTALTGGFRRTRRSGNMTLPAVTDNGILFYADDTSYSQSLAVTANAITFANKNTLCAEFLPRGSVSDTSDYTGIRVGLRTGTFSDGATYSSGYAATNVFPVASTFMKYDKLSTTGHTTVKVDISAVNTETYNVGVWSSCVSITVYKIWLE